MLTETERGLHRAHSIVAEMHKRVVRDMETLPWWAFLRRAALRDKAIVIFEVTNVIFDEAQAAFKNRLNDT